jgi:hypothetical protein
MQAAGILLMIRPLHFRCNEETASNNSFQSAGISPPADLNNRVTDEFNALEEALKEKGIQVLVYNSEEGVDTPDALFPNNWISFHEDGRVAIYPMFAPNRRRERREDIIWNIMNEAGVEIIEIVDFTEFEDHNKFLEGTGSLVIDHEFRKVYASLSQRTDGMAVTHFAEVFGYDPVVFEAFHESERRRQPVYHTNVLMSIAEGYAIICPMAIDEEERELVMASLRESRREIIEISPPQMNAFCGNILMVKNEEGLPYTVMSERAFRNFTEDQLAIIRKFSSIISIPLYSIEDFGGGSARCLLAEVFLPKI